MSKETGGPAFPAPAGVQHITEQGMTLRDYFAAKAMEGFCSTLEGVTNHSMPKWVNLAEDAYSMADAMLKAREQ